MIKLINSLGTEILFKITKFPDGTSQSWQIEETLRSDLNSYRILWLFENESELVHICQLSQLCYKHFGVHVQLVAPFLPYGRQDKEVDNSSTFALGTMLTLLKAAGVTCVYTYDAHPTEPSTILPIISMDNTEFIDSIWDHDLIVFPDLGAQERYSCLERPSYAARKRRNQLTGKIEGIVIMAEGLRDKKILLVDDLADGGATFVALMEQIEHYNPKQVDLAVSHGIFSKGRVPLLDAGIKNIYTTNTLDHIHGILNGGNFDAINSLITNRKY